MAEMLTPEWLRPWWPSPVTLHAGTEDSTWCCPYPHFFPSSGSVHASVRPLFSARIFFTRSTGTGEAS